MRKITEIILHCSATPEGKDFRAKQIDEWHKAKGWKCVGYNFIVDLDGTVEDGRPLYMTGAHTIGHNKNSIGICYIGGLEKDGKKAKDTRTPEQKKSMYLLVYQLLNQFELSIKDVHCHNEFAAKACPSFNIEDFSGEYEDWLYSFYKSNP